MWANYLNFSKTLNVQYEDSIIVIKPQTLEPELPELPAV